MKAYVLGVALGSTLLVLAGSVRAQGPHNGSSHEWYQSLRSPATGGGCCSDADCKVVNFRLTAEHYEIYVDDKWMQVPDEVVLVNKENPTGGAVACLWNGKILCFVPSYLV